MVFTATGNSAAPAENPISNDGFFPAVDPVLARATMRLDGTTTPARLLDALIDSMASVNAELGNWKATQQGLNYATLVDVPALPINGISILQHRYFRAVYALAKASLSERYRDYDTTNLGIKKAEQIESPIDDLRRDARWAISDIIGTRRTVVELI